MNKFGEAE